MSDKTIGWMLAEHVKLRDQYRAALVRLEEVKAAAIEFGQLTGWKHMRDFDLDPRWGGPEKCIESATPGGSEQRARISAELGFQLVKAYDAGELEIPWQVLEKEPYR